MTRRLAAFASIAASLAHSEDLDRTLPQALRAVLDALGLEAGGIYLLDEATGELRATEHHFGLPAELPEAVQRFRRGEAVLGRAIDCVRPVVVPDVGDVATVARHGENAWIVRDSTPEAYAEAILTLLGDDERRARLAQGALATRERFRTEYSLEAAQRVWRAALFGPPPTIAR